MNDKQKFEGLLKNLNLFFIRQEQNSIHCENVARVSKNGGDNEGEKIATNIQGVYDKVVKEGNEILKYWKEMD